MEPISWAYADLRTEGVDQRALQARRVADMLEQDGAQPRAVSVVVDRLVEAPVAPLTFAIFVTDDGTLVHEQHLPGTETPDRAGHAVLADVLPLLAHDQARPPYVSVVIDRSGADISFSAGGSASEQHVAVVGTDDEIRHPATGGWAGLEQSRMTRRAEDSWQHNAAQVAARVAGCLAEVHAQALIVAGDERSQRLMLEHTPMGPEVLVRRVRGSRSSHRDQQTAAVRVALDEIVRAQTAHLLETLRDRLGPAGLATEGPEDTFAALRAGRVLTLVMDPSAHHERAWFGARGTAVYRRHDDAVTAAEPVEAGPVALVAVRSALLSGGRVRLISQDVDAAPAIGIGAICRHGSGTAAD